MTSARGRQHLRYPQQPIRCLELLFKPLGSLVFTDHRRPLNDDFLFGPKPRLVVCKRANNCIWCSWSKWLILHGVMTASTPRGPAA